MGTENKIKKVKIKELPQTASINDDDIFVESDTFDTYKVAADDIAKYVSENKHLTDKYAAQSSIGAANGIAPLNSNKKIDGTYITYGSSANTVYEGSSGKILEQNLDNHLLDDDAHGYNTKINLKAPSANPTFTGVPKAPTASAETNTTQIATTAFAQTAVSNHNSSATAHTDIRDLITCLTNRLNALADSDDTTLDQLSEIVTYIKSNRTLIDNVTTNKINVSDIVDSLMSTATNKPLSAKQGKILKDLIDSLKSALDTHTGDSDIHITPTERTNWNDAFNKRHTHGNKSVLDGITSAIVNKWNSLVSTVANQGLSDTEKANARTNIGLNNAIISGSQTTTSSADGGNNVYTFTDASGNTSTITVKNGSKGSTGASGTNGKNGTSVSISSTSVTYQAGSSGTSTPTGAWSTTIPNTSAGQYLWTKTVVTYSDGKSTTAYSVSRNGTNGTNGSNGSNGTAGIGISKVEQTTASTADGGTNVCTITLTNGNTYTFSFKNGSKGSTGAKGTNGTNGTSAAWFTGTAVIGVSSSAISVSVSGSKAGDMYLNTSTCNVYRANAANSWIYICNIKGANGTNGTNATTTAVVSKTANGLAPKLPNETATTKYLRQDGTWQVPPNTNTDTKNTAGSTNSSSKLFLIGATSQAANPQTYSRNTAYVGTDGCLYSNNTRVVSEIVSSTEPTTQKDGDYWLKDY